MDIKNIKNNKETYIQNQIKRFLSTEQVDRIILNYEELIELGKKFDDYRCLIGKISKRISFLLKDKETNKDLVNIEDDTNFDSDFFDDMIIHHNHIDTYTIDTLKNISSVLGKYVKNIEAKRKKIEIELEKEYHKLPNLIHESVVISNNEDNNTVIAINHEENLAMRNVVINEIKPNYKSLNLTHVELLDKLGFVDIVSGTKVSGNRGYFLKGIGVKFNMALLAYATEFLEARGFTLMETPEMMTKDAMSQVSQLSEFDETLYKIEEQDKFLIATSEQPITASFKDVIIEPKELPIKIGGLSSCFRKEAGKHGADTLGIFRVHQFKKVEQFCVTKPEESWKMFEEMINNSKEFYDSLGLSYRVVNIVSGALNNAAAMKYDLEAYFPGSENYKELVSCSNCLDYFSKRIGTKAGFGNARFIPHMLNATLCANTRTICCLAESYQTNEGIVVPVVLRSYLGDIDFIPFKK